MAKDKIEEMSDDQLVQFCMDEISQGTGGTTKGEDNDDDQIVDLAYDYYFGRTPGLSKQRARDKNASRFVSQDVMDAVESTVEQVMPAFNTDELGFYQPIDEGDEDQCQTESEIVNYLFMEEYYGHTILQVALKDALLNRNCNAKAFWDERIEVEYETFEDVPELMLPEYLQPESEDQKIEVVAQETIKEGDPTAREVIGDIIENPQMMQGADQEDMAIAEDILEAGQNVYNIKVKRTTKVGKPIIINTPPETVIVKSGHHTVHLHECGFVAQECVENKASLVAQGFDMDQVMNLPEYNGNSLGDKARSRNESENRTSSSHWSMTNTLVFECYPFVDFDGDGIAERRKVTIGSDKTLLGNEEFTGNPIIGGAVILVPHKYRGVSMFERIKDIQDAKTPVMRSIIDGTQLSSNPRIGVLTGQANLDDIITSRSGGMVRAESKDAVFELPKGEVPQSSYGFLQHMDGIRRDRGAGSVDNVRNAQSIAGAGGGAHGVERIMSAMELSDAMLAKNLAETLVRGIYLQLHEMLRKHYKGTIKRKMKGRWVETVPREWKKRTAVTIQVAESFSKRIQQMEVLKGVIAQQEKLAQAGSVMFDEQRYYAAITDYIKLGGLRSPERYFSDPGSPEGEQKNAIIGKTKEEMKRREEEAQATLVKAQETLAEAEAMKGKAANDANLAKVTIEGLKQRLEQLRLQLDAAKENADLKFKYDKMMEDVALRLTEMEMKYKNGGELDVKHAGNKPGAQGESTAES